MHADLRTRDTYECSMCHGVFENYRPEEDARAEASALFGELSDPGTDAVVCDDCWRSLVEPEVVVPLDGHKFSVLTGDCAHCGVNVDDHALAVKLLPLRDGLTARVAPSCRGAR